MTNWEWPQYVFLILMILTLIGKGRMHGTDREVRADYGAIDFVIVGWILYMGGFWT